MKQMIFVLCTVFALNFSFGQEAATADTYTLTVTITGFSNDKGEVVVGLYDSKELWLNKPFMGKVEKINDQVSQVTFENVPSGVYGISLYHDENSDAKLNTNSFGMPSEKYACSKGAKGKFGPPAWKDAKFEIKEDMTMPVKL